MRVPWDSRWKEVKGFPGYFVSQYGQVFNLPRKNLMNESKKAGRRPYVTLRRNKKAYSRSVRMLKEIAFGKEGEK